MPSCDRSLLPGGGGGGGGRSEKNPQAIINERDTEAMLAQSHRCKTSIRAEEKHIRSGHRRQSAAPLSSGSHRYKQGFVTFKAAPAAAVAEAT